MSTLVTAFNDIQAKASSAHTIHMGGQVYSDIVSEHIQGFAAYGDYFIATRNMVQRAHGKILIMGPGKRFLYDFDSISGSGSGDYNHPGGIQVLDELGVVAVAVETKHYERSLVTYYDLRNLGSERPQLYENLTIDAPDHGMGMVGITRYKDNSSGHEYFLTVGCDNGKLSFYRSNQYKFGDPEFRSDEVRREENDDLGDSKVNSINLFTDEENQVWLLDFHFDDGSNTDRIKLFKIDLDNFKIDRSFTSLNRHMVNDYGEGPDGSSGIHFRWGASAKLVNPTTMQLVACQRNIVANMLNYDIWT